MPNPWTGKGNPYTRAEVLDRLHATLRKGEPIIAAGAGTGISAKFIEKGGADLVIVYNSGRFRMAGHGSTAGLMAYGDANQVAMEIGEYEVLPVVEEIPVICGVHATDPRRRMWHWLLKVKDMGFSGVNNFPTHCIVDGRFRQILEETGMSVRKEFEMVALARKMDLFTIVYVSQPQESRAMAEAGADAIIAHVGTTVGGAIGVKEAVVDHGGGRAPHSSDHRRRPDGPPRHPLPFPRRSDLLAGGRGLRQPTHRRRRFRRRLEPGTDGRRRLPHPVDPAVQEHPRPCCREDDRRAAMPVIAVLGTMDTKADELGYVAGEIRRLGHEPLLVDVGTGGPPGIVPDISREDVAAASGIDLAALVARQDRGECVTAMAAAAAVLLPRLAREARIDGILALGGGGGTAIGTAAMRALPIGFPKLMVSTLATGNTAPYVGGRDIVMFPSIVDVSGLNRISRLLLSRAAGAICGMVARAARAGAPGPARDRCQHVRQHYGLRHRSPGPSSRRRATRSSSSTRPAPAERPWRG